MKSIVCVISAVVVVLFEVMFVVTPVSAQSSSNVTPVTDAMLQNPAPEDKLIVIPHQ